MTFNVRPIRIQRKRTKGWRMPPNTVYVGRPTKWGNPFKVGGRFMIGDPNPKSAGVFRMIWCEAHIPDSRFTLIRDSKTATEFYRRLIAKNPPQDIEQLRDKDLACWCPLDQPCHADVLLGLALKVV